MPPYPLPIRHPPLTPQILLNLLPPLDPLIQTPHLLILPTSPELPHRLRKRVTHAVQALEEHEVRVGELAAVEVFPSLAALRVECVFEVGEEFRDAVGEVIC